MHIDGQLFEYDGRLWSIQSVNEDGTVWARQLPTKSETETQWLADKSCRLCLFEFFLNEWVEFKRD